MTPDKAEGPPASEGPSENVMSVETTPAPTATASTSEDNTGVIRLSRAKPKPPSMIYSEVSIVALVAACDRRLVGEHDVPILVNLLGRAGKEAGHWQCWPSIGTVADEVGVHASTVNRAIRRLERFGYMVRWGQYRDNRQTSNVYRFKVPDYTELPEDHPYHDAPIREIDDVPGARVPWGGVHGSTGEGGTGAPPRGGTRALQNASKELPPLNAFKELPRDFVEDEDQERNEEERRESNGKSQDLTGFWFKGEWRPYGKQPAGGG